MVICMTRSIAALNKKGNSYTSKQPLLLSENNGITIFEISTIITSFLTERSKHHRSILDFNVVGWSKGEEGGFNILNEIM